MKDSSITKIKIFQEIIDESKNIVFFGGAGVSTESGIPDFRSTSGLYNQEWNYPPEIIISHSFFEQNTSEFFRFYCKKMISLNTKPNECHFKLAQLEKNGKLLAVVTQNIDGLHQIAGSKKVYELHGSVHRNYCLQCNHFENASFIVDNHKKQSDGIPRCPKCNGIMKPDVVLYEENLNNSVIENSIKEISQADTLIIGGTSLIVYPAAGLVEYFRGKNLVIVNLNETKQNNRADLVIDEKIGEVFSKLEI
ncbi:MAG: NAD-dependent protein deacylase [Treponemataceae bacterium]